VRIGDIVGPSFVYQTESTILRATVRTQRVDDAFLRARRQTRNWLHTICERYGVQVPQADATLSNDKCSLDLILRPQRLVAALRHADDRFPERVWHVNLDLCAEEGGDVAACSLLLRAEHPSNSRPIEPYAARLFGMLCDDPGLDDAEAMRASAVQLAAAGVPQLASLIAAQRRRFAVILVSDPPALDANALARDLAGLAHVFRLEPEASWAISHRFEPRYSAYQGAVKIYPPNVNFKSEPNAAPLFLQQTLQMLARESKAESTIRRGVLADVTAQFETGPFVTPAALRSQELRDRAPAVVVKAAEPAAPVAEPVPLADEADLHRARREVAAARQEAAAARQEAEGYWREVLELNGKVEKLEAEVAQLRETELGISVEELSPGNRDLLRMIFESVTQTRDALLENDRLTANVDHLQAEYASLRRRLAQNWKREEGSVSRPARLLPRPEWSDFEALEAWANAQYGGALVFHPRVRDRLRDGNVQDVDALFDILDILGTDYVDMKRGLEGAWDRYAERTKRFKAGKALTDVGAGIVGDAYACSFDGKSYGGEDHQHIRERGKNFAGRTACVYFIYDDAHGRVVVTSMPRHLDTVNKRS
jgi:tetratricopeptide (TPR) repeat protein